MADLQVTHISGAALSDGSLTFVGITDLGGPGWHWAREEVVRAIEQGVHTFYLVARESRLELAIVKGAVGSYVRSRDERGWTDDLLALPHYVEESR